MGLYTVCDNQSVDDAISVHLDRIVESLKAVLPVSSIILGGGFGRGEGGVLVTEGDIRPVNDYDFFLVLPDDFTADLKSLGRDLAQQVNIRLVDLIPLRHSALRTLPATQLHYDLKYGGRLLWGDDAISLIPSFREGHIDPQSANTLLLNRLICAIEAFSEEFEKRALSDSEAFFLVNQTGKVVSACVEALLIGRGKYHHSYRERQMIFGREFPEHVLLLLLNERATAFKIKPSLSFCFNPVTYWKDAIKIYLKVMASCLTMFTSSEKGLWQALKADTVSACLTNNPVERIELMLLLCYEASFFSKFTIMSTACNELNHMIKTPFRLRRWEIARQRTVRLWHELYH